MGRGSPRRGSREKRDQTEVKLIEHMETHNKSWKSIQHIYDPPEILRSMIFSTVSCLQADNDVSTSNSPPARNIVMIYPDYYIEIYIPKISKYYTVSLPKSGKQQCCISKNTQIHS